MSWWIMPTTADVGLRSFSKSASGVIRETTLGYLQAIILFGNSSILHLGHFYWFCSHMDLLRYNTVGMERSLLSTTMYSLLDICLLFLVAFG